MAGRVFSLWFYLLLAMVIAGAFSRRQPKVTPSANQCMFQQPRCGLCGKSINVTIIARNNLTQPNFEHRVTVTDPQRPLFFFLQKAADANGAFNFTTSYHGNLGHMVTAINKLAANVADKTYWQISSVTNGNSSALLCGVSTYTPRKGEHILFNFTTWG